MKSQGDEMGRFEVEFEIANNIDLVLASHGQLDPKSVRRMRVSGLVDSGATRLVLPQRVADQLGLPKLGRTRTRYADGRESHRDRVDEVRLTLQGRSGVFDAIVEPQRETALIGALVLETLDFLVDCAIQKLVPRDPQEIVSELE